MILEREREGGDCSGVNIKSRDILAEFGWPKEETRGRLLACNPARLGFCLSLSLSHVVTWFTGVVDIFFYTNWGRAKGKERIRIKLSCVGYLCSGSLSMLLLHFLLMREKPLNTLFTVLHNPDRSFRQLIDICFSILIDNN